MTGVVAGPVLFTLTRQRFDAVIFDLDGVVTSTARLHSAAWKEMWDRFLAGLEPGEGRDLSPFTDDDYRRYVDGKLRFDGVRSFLSSRGISLSEGTPKDDPAMDTVHGLGIRKDLLFQERLAAGGVEVYPSTITLIHALRGAGFRTAIISSSRHCPEVLAEAGIAGLFDARVDGNDMDRLGLTGKPEPDIFLEAARRLEVPPERAVIIEDALSGVEAGRRGGFGCVIGVERSGRAGGLREAGADLVVPDLAVIGVGGSHPAGGRTTDTLPRALDCLEAIRHRIGERDPAVFLDYDGTLTPIVSRPELAVISAVMRDTVGDLARRCTVAVISGRDLADVEARVGVAGIVYAGSHGIDIAGPGGLRATPTEAEDYLPVLDLAERELRRLLEPVPGALVERKRYTLAAHYRLVAGDAVDRVRAVVELVQGWHPELRITSGKKVLELRPGIAWDKGRAIRWLLGALVLKADRVVPLYIGDDLTDEDAFLALAGSGIGLVVRDDPRPTVADYALDSVDDVQRFLAVLASWLTEGGR